MMFSEHATMQQLGLSGDRPDPGELSDDFLDDLFLRTSLASGCGELMTGRDDDLVIPASVMFLLHQLRTVEHPLRKTIDEDRVRERRDFTIEPEMHAGDGGRFKLFDARQFCATGELGRQQIEHALVGNGEHDPICSDVSAIPKFDAGYFAVGDVDLFDAALETDLSTACGQPVTDCGAVQLFEGRCGNQNLPAVAGAEKAIHENLAGMREADAVQAFAECTDKDHVPEAIDDGLRLPVCLEPVGHGWFVFWIDAGACELFESLGQFAFLAEVEIGESREGGKQMQGCGERRTGGKAVHLEAGVGVDGTALMGTDEVELLGSFEGIGDADGLAEAIEFETAAHADVLTVVDQGLGLLVFKGARAPPESGSGLEQGDRLIPLRESRSAGQAGETASDNDCCCAAVFQ